MIEIISNPWPWYVSGPLISLVMITMLILGKQFGVSSNLRTMCSIAGAGKYAEFFRFDWKKDVWNLIFIIGVLIGSFISREFLTTDPTIAISTQTITDLKAMGISNPGVDYVPVEIFNWSTLLTLKGFLFIVLGGFLIGFGTRYAGGCTSGHAISGLSNLQLPSLIAVVGFFIGGLFVTFLVLPYLLDL